MTRHWWQRALNSIADRGRELLKLSGRTEGVEALGALCHRLLVNRGEASGIALAREVLNKYALLDHEKRLEFFRVLASEFNPDTTALQSAMSAYLADPAPRNLTALVSAVEPPRQDLLRSLNMAPGGTSALVQMRSDLLDFLPDDDSLSVVDSDLKHLFASWFNRGFLDLERIDWHSPADVLEKLIRYESVHVINGWDDLRRRLANDRSCYAFFHPAMPEVPLIFVEVALVKGMASNVQPLLDVEGVILDPTEADTAIFYSINNTQKGLRGISFGNFLIKQVLMELNRDFPHIRLAATLSPMPRFRRTLENVLHGELSTLTEQMLDALLHEQANGLRNETGVATPLRALVQQLEDTSSMSMAARTALERVAVAYLSAESRGMLLDPVARFHLANGARIERINISADGSKQGREASYGVMVNYVYDLEQVEANHENFINDGEIASSRSLSRILRDVERVRAASVGQRAAS